MIALDRRLTRHRRHTLIDEIRGSASIALRQIVDHLHQKLAFCDGKEVRRNGTHRVLLAAKRLNLKSNRGKMFHILL